MKRSSLLTGTAISRSETAIAKADDRDWVIRGQCKQGDHYEHQYDGRTSYALVNGVEVDSRVGPWKIGVENFRLYWVRVI